MSLSAIGLILMAGGMVLMLIAIITLLQDNNMTMFWSLFITGTIIAIVGGVLIYWGMPAEVICAQ